MQGVCGTFDLQTRGSHLEYSEQVKGNIVKNNGMLWILSFKV